jgi:allophanate hydrolase
MLPLILDLAAIRQFYEAGNTPLELVEEVIRRCLAWTDKAVFISLADIEYLRSAASGLMETGPKPNSLPLWGVPFVVKDNIDVAGFETTAGCPAFAYKPREDASVVARLKAAGALVIGKTNLDQFATGLNGTRSPYGAPRAVFDRRFISGGSSSGSAVAVAAGLCSFALGTDTAGSGRVPAAFNNLVGVKPSLGLLSTNGVVPACRTLDCVSIFAVNVADGIAVRLVAEGFDADDPFSRKSEPVSLPARPRIGVLAGIEREFYGNSDVENCYDAAIAAAQEGGADIVPIDYAPFREAAELLYGGPWVAERLAGISDFFAGHQADMDPTVRSIIGGGRAHDAVSAFKGRYRLAELRRQTEATWSRVDMLLLPTTPTTYTVEQMLAEPVLRNSHLGRYTNFVNLFDLAAIAIPAGFGRQTNLPAGVTLVGPAFSDDALASYAAELHVHIGKGAGMDRSAPISQAGLPAPKTETVDIVVVGAHLTGMPLNRELVELGGQLVRACRTASDYRLFALLNTIPPKPGLVKSPNSAGSGIDVEVWSLPVAGFGKFVSKIPAPLGIGKVTLEDNTAVCGFLCEQHAVQRADEITQYGGWRAYMSELES